LQRVFLYSLCLILKNLFFYLFAIDPTLAFTINKILIQPPNKK
jgi:hypothetical protein